MVEMVEIQYIVAFAMGVINIFKDRLPKSVVPFAAIGLSVVLNLLNAYIFGGDLLTAGKDGFVIAGIMVGLFAGGDAIRKNVQK